MLHDHLCVCDFGFTGSDCNKNIDDCFVNICENNATCIDKIGSYDCLCKDGYKGDYCEITIGKRFLIQNLKYFSKGAQNVFF